MVKIPKRKKPVFYKNLGCYDVDDPMWVVGSIDSHGAIHARHASSDGDVMHKSSECIGRRFRWNIWGQEWGQVLGIDNLTNDEIFIVTDWLEKHGYKKPED